jgi:AcrR family transcriptional regulator
MGRKSLKAERVSEILDAFERCVEAKGLQGTTLDNIAEESGMARRMIRHYVGNRKEVIDAGVTRIISKFENSVLQNIEHTIPEKRFELAFDYIFSDAFNQLPATRLVAALLPVSLYDPDVQASVKSIYDFFRKGLAQELMQLNLQANESEIEQAAYSIMCLSFGGGWMSNIGFDSRLNEKNKKIASDLINSLKQG